MKVKTEKIKEKKYSHFLPYLFTFPAVFLMVLLVFYPIIITFSYSLKEMKLNTKEEAFFIGLNNYTYILTSNDFWYSLQNTILVLIMVLLFTVTLGLFVALILNVDSKLKNILTAVAIIPWALPPVVNGILWRLIFYPGYGLINKILVSLNLINTPIEWVASRYSLMFIISIVVSWRVIPFCAIILLSGIRSIPESIYEAGRIDGANTVKIFFKITLPLILPAIAIVVTSVSITAVNVFDEIITISGFTDKGKTLLLHDYITTFTFLNFGMGSALAYIIMLISGVLGILYIKNVFRKTEYL